MQIRIRISDPARYQDLSICSLAYCQPSLKTSCKSVRIFLLKVAYRQITDKRRRLHILLGGGNEKHQYQKNYSNEKGMHAPVIFNSAVSGVTGAAVTAGEGIAAKTLFQVQFVYHLK